jgi:plastocyanin
MAGMTTSLLRPRRSVPALGFCLALCLLLLGSGSSSAGANATASAAKQVSIVNFAFKPGNLRVKRGAGVGFANTANTTHTASGAAFDTKRIEPGKTVTVKFNKRGTFAYHCKIHPFMKGKVVVE